MRNAIALVTDARLFPAAAFAAYRIASLNERDDTDIFIFTDARDELRLAPERSYPFKVVPIVQPEGINVPPAFFRIFVPLQMISRYARVLYMDVDTYLEDARPLRLFDLDMRGHAIAAVRDYNVAYRPEEGELQAVLGGRHLRYFNSGMMLVDCAEYVRRRAAERLVKVMASRPTNFIFVDQSLFNNVFDGDFLELSPACNFLIAALGTPLEKVCPPALFHFAGPQKPWMGPNFIWTHKACAEMERYFPRSWWPDFLPRFFNAETLSRPRTQAPSKSLDWGFEGPALIAHYLRETEFADVTAGISPLHLEALPPAPARA